MIVCLPPPSSYDFPSPVGKEKQHNGFSPPKDVFERQPAELVELALAKLQAEGVKLIEWRALLYRRMEVPIFVKDFSYVVPDEDLTRASELLSDMGLPRAPRMKLLTRVEGDIYNKATYHRLTRSSAPAWSQHFVLYPASFVSIDPQELYTTTPMHLSPSSSTIKTLVPKPSAVYGWLLRTMSKYPRLCSERTILASDLSELVDYHLLRVQQGFVDLDRNPERWRELDMDGRIADAHELIGQWTRNYEWREGEEWFGDALAAIVSGDGNIEHLPSSGP